MNNIKIVDCLLAYLNKEIIKDNYTVHKEEHKPKTFTIVCNNKDFSEIFQRIINSEVNGFSFHIKDISTTGLSPSFYFYITVDVLGNVYVRDDISYDFCDNTTTLLIPPNINYKIPSNAKQCQATHDNVPVWLNV